MMQLTITPAGIAAIVDPETGGTNAVLVSEIGITSAAFDPAAVSALPAEIKRITTFAGQSVSADTITVNIADASPDIYTMRGFALYLDDGTLFALYGQPVQTTIIEKASPSTMLLTCDVRFAQLDATSITFGDSTWTNPPASETVPGVSRRATTQQHIDSVATDVTATPAGIKALLDFRFGNGAPSNFVKGLLNVATAALFRVAIGLKDVATREMGQGGGIDADMLDGKHANEFANSSHGHTIPNVAGLQIALDAKAPVASPAFTGTPTAPTPATADNTTRLATTAYVQAVIANVIASAPGALDTLNELAVALGNDPNFAATITNALAQKAPLASPALLGVPTAPTAAPGTNTAQIASTAFVQAAIAAALEHYLPKNNPTFTGTMTGPSYNKVP